MKRRMKTCLGSSRWVLEGFLRQSKFTNPLTGKRPTCGSNLTCQSSGLHSNEVLMQTLAEGSVMCEAVQKKRGIRILRRSATLSYCDTFDIRAPLVT